jgi:hypothetical protein
MSVTLSLAASLRAGDKLEAQLAKPASRMNNNGITSDMEGRPFKNPI